MNHADSVRHAVRSEPLRDEAAAIVDVERRRGTAVRERPPQAVRGLSSSLSKEGGGRPQEAGPIIEDGVYVDVDLPEGIYEAALEPLEGEGFPDDRDHQPEACEDPVDRHPAHSNATTSEEGVDP
jgi:hypothetical protein